MGHGEGEKFDRFSPVYTALPIRILPLRSSLEGGGGRDLFLILVENKYCSPLVSRGLSLEILNFVRSREGDVTGR